MIFVASGWMNRAVVWIKLHCGRCRYKENKADMEEEEEVMTGGEKYCRMR